jgi:hypothetical protein
MPRQISRESAEAKFARTQSESKSVVDAERDATRAKTARLKAERLAKTAAEGTTILDRKPSKKARPKN